MYKVIILAASAFVAQVMSRVSPGVCQYVPLQANFTVEKYLGVWFSQAKDANSPGENGNCAQSRYALNANGSIAAVNSQFMNETQQVVQTPATGVCEGPHCQLWFRDQLNSGDYRIVSTDYDNYVVIYSCRNLPDKKFELSWIMTRERYPDRNIIFKAL